MLKYLTFAVYCWHDVRNYHFRGLWMLRTPPESYPMCFAGMRHHRPKGRKVLAHLPLPMRLQDAPPPDRKGARFLLILFCRELPDALCRDAPPPTERAQGFCSTTFADSYPMFLQDAPPPTDKAQGFCSSTFCRWSPDVLAGCATTDRRQTTARWAVKGTGAQGKSSVIRRRKVDRGFAMRTCAEKSRRQSCTCPPDERAR